MTDIYPIQAIFTKGELSPRLHSRVDTELFKMGAEYCSNFVPFVQGGIYKRSGFKYVSPSIQDLDTQTSRLVEFVFSSEQSYVLEFGDMVIRLYAQGARVESPPGTPYEISVPYSNDEIWAMDFVQSADTLYMAHPNYPMQALKRITETNWTVEEVIFKNGPYFGVYDGVDGENVMELTGGDRPSGSFLASTNSGTSDGVAAMWDDDTSTFWESGQNDTPSPSSPVWNQINFTGSNKFACNGFRIGMTTGNTSSPTDEQTFPRDFQLQGWDGSDWVTVWSVSGRAYLPGETETFEFVETPEYEMFRIAITQNNGSNWCTVGFLQLSLIGLPATLTWDNTNGINDGAGWQDPEDIGRLVRYADQDGLYRQFRVENIDSPTQLSGLQDGFWTAQGQNYKTTIWQIGAFSPYSGYPHTVAIFQERLVLGGSRAAPRTVWLSKSAGYLDFGVSQPIQDDDSITIGLSGSRQDRIQWIVEILDMLFCGTSDDVMSIGGTNNNVISPTNLIIKSMTAHGSAELVDPRRVGRSLLFVGEHGSVIHDLGYAEGAGAFDSPIITNANEHLFRSGIVQMAWAEGPDFILYVAMADGSLTAIAYDRGESVIGAVPLVVGGTDVEVKSIACIPEGNRHRLYASIERTINGQRRRYIEQLQPPFEDQDQEESWFLDGSLKYDGVATNTFSGLDHLEGEEVTVVGWNDEGSFQYNPDETQTVVSGSITTTYNYTQCVIGLSYLANLVMMRIFTSARDGSSFGRRAKIDRMLVDFYRSRAVQTGSVVEDLPTDDLIERNDGDPMDNYPPLFTGVKDIPITDSFESFGQARIYSEDPHPCLIRSVTPITEVEGL